MNSERFQVLAETYGADLARWPEAELAAAAAFARTRPEAAGILAGEQVLEARLNAYQVTPGPALRERIIAATTRVRAAARAWRWMTAAGLSLGLAASCAAGVAAGLVFAPASLTGLISGAPGADDVSALADPAGDAGTG
jgi:hypothetical protein